MFDSLRARLLLWYTVVLGLVTVAFGGTVCYLFWNSALTSVDAELNGQAQGIARVLKPAVGGTFDVDLSEEAVRYFDLNAGGPYYAIWSAGGELIARYDPTLDVPVPPGAGARMLGGRREVAVQIPDGAIVLVGRDIPEVRRDFWGLATTIAVVGLFALGLSFAGGWFLSGLALAPIARISRTAQAMSEGDLSARIAVDRTESELGQLASTLNDAFDRLSEAVARQQRFTADASHELRTPLATLSAELEWALSRERRADEYRGSLETCSRSASRMRGVVEGLLALARVDAGEPLREQADVQLRPLVLETVAQLRPLAERCEVAVAVDEGPATGTVRGDPGLLRQAVMNLVSNAIQYNRKGGSVTIAVRDEDPAVFVEVTDTGQGIPREALPRVFDRFFRADEARARAVGGSGLGLALVKRIVDAHGGDISCSSEAGLGARFVIRLRKA
jgi:heavy metal sensor kinase